MFTVVSTLLGKRRTMTDHLISRLQPFWEKVLSEPEACIEKTIGSILFESLQSFSPFILHFVNCFDNYLLLPLFDILI